MKFFLKCFLEFCPEIVLPIILGILQEIFLEFFVNYVGQRGKYKISRSHDLPKCYALEGEKGAS